MHTLQDDLESIFWALLYVIMRYIAYDIDIDTRLDDIQHVFFQNQPQHARNHDRGGAGKLDIVDTPILYPRLSNNTPLDDLMWSFLTIIQDFHEYMKRIFKDVSRIRHGHDEISIPDALKTASLKFNEEFDRLDIRNYDKILAIFATALQQDTWPENDKAFDHYTVVAQGKRKLQVNEDTENERSTSKRSKTNEQPTRSAQELNHSEGSRMRRTR